MKFPYGVLRQNVLNAIKNIDENGQLPANKSKHWYLYYNGQLYSSKYIIAVAAKDVDVKSSIITTDFNSSQANSHLQKLGFEIVGIKLLSDNAKSILSNVITKQLDKSSFVYDGTVVPKKAFGFFGIEDIKRGEKKVIKFLYRDRLFNVFIQKSDQERSLTRLFWHKDLKQFINEMYPVHYRLFKSGGKQTSVINMSIYKTDVRDIYEFEFSRAITDEANQNDLENRLGNLEGDLYQTSTIKHKRSYDNRKKAISIHGLSCNICGFNFEDTYGDIGSDFIEVHHKKPLSEADGSILIEPSKDLITLCANCHRMIHRIPGKILTINELKLSFKHNKDKN